LHNDIDLNESLQDCV